MQILVIRGENFQRPDFFSQKIFFMQLDFFNLRVPAL